MKKICVLGSLNVDLTLKLPRFHTPGETITAAALDTYAGGKGGNQAVAAAKLGAQVLMAGKLGNDQNGRFYRQVLEANGIDLSGVETVPSAASGTALIEVDPQGENRIAIVAGTNALVDRAQVDRLLPQLLGYDIFLMQLEIPLDTVCYAAQALSARGKTVILDPAPAVPLPDSLYRQVSYVTPNTTELSLLTGLPADSPQAAAAAARRLLAKGVGGVIAKMGERGCLYVAADQADLIPGYPVQAVDTTAAGDSFNAGFAVALALGKPIREALAFANGVGALSTTGPGAQGAMPTLSQVKVFLGNH